MLSIMYDIGIRGNGLRRYSESWRGYRNVPCWIRRTHVYVCLLLRNQMVTAGSSTGKSSLRLHISPSVSRSSISRSLVGVANTMSKKTKLAARVQYTALMANSLLEFLRESRARQTSTIRIFLRQQRKVGYRFQVLHSSNFRSQGSILSATGPVRKHSLSRIGVIRECNASRRHFLWMEA